MKRDIFKMLQNNKFYLFSTGMFVISCLFFFASCDISNKYEDFAAFHWFEYEGHDAVYEQLELGEDEYANPIIKGFYPDPSIVRVDDDFYMVHSSFSYYPGVPIFHSKDLVNWEKIGHVLDRPSQLNLDNLSLSSGIFAPTIRYHEGTYYMITTLVGGEGNFFVTAENPEGPWSDPVWLPEIDGIDPSIFFDDDGRTYIYHNAPPPGNESLYGGHRSLRMWEYDLENNEFAGESILLVDGGVDITEEPVWIEAPHIFHKDGYYYMIAAEGGTGYNHSQVVFRSDNITGPYEPGEKNPILTQRHLDPERPNPVTSSGHADFVQLSNGEWWSVFLACRPYEEDFYNTGRETFMLPVNWEEGEWPEIQGGLDPIPFVHKRPGLLDSPVDWHPTSGNFSVKHNFEEPELDYSWSFIRTPREEWFALKDNTLYINPRDEIINDLVNPSFIGRRQQHLNFSSSAALSYDLKNSDETAGLVAYQNDNHYLLVGIRKDPNDNTEVYLEKASGLIADGDPRTIANQQLAGYKPGGDISFKIEGKGRYYSFYYKIGDEDQWLLLKKDVDASILSTNVAGGFVGVHLGMYASAKHFDR